MKKFPVDLPNRTPVALADQVLINNSATNTTSYSTVQQIYDAASLLVLFNVNGAGANIIVGDPLATYLRLTSTNLEFNRPALTSYIYNKGIGGNTQILTSNVASGDVNAMMILANGKIGIGIVAPAVSLESNGGIGTTLGSGGIYLSGDGGPDSCYLGYNYYNISSAETAPAAARRSYRIRFMNGGTPGIYFDRRAAAAAAGAFTNYFTIRDNGVVNILLASVTIYANNAAAVLGGLVAGDIYRTGADPDVMCIVH